jgi:hypothetical protein
MNSPTCKNRWPAPDTVRGLPPSDRHRPVAPRFKRRPTRSTEMPSRLPATSASPSLRFVRLSQMPRCSSDRQMLPARVPPSAGRNRLSNNLPTALSKAAGRAALCIVLIGLARCAPCRHHPGRRSTTQAWWPRTQAKGLRIRCQQAAKLVVAFLATLPFIDSC